MTHAPLPRALRGSVNTARPLLLAATLALPALLAGCTTLDGALPVGEAEAGHAGFACPTAQYVTGFDAEGVPRCGSIPGRAPAGDAGSGFGSLADLCESAAASPEECFLLEYLEEMRSLEARSYNRTLFGYELADRSIPPEKLEGGIPADLLDLHGIQEALVDRGALQARVWETCGADEFVQAIEEDGRVQCAAPIGAAGDGSGSGGGATGPVTTAGFRPNAALSIMPGNQPVHGPGSTHGALYLDLPPGGTHRVLLLGQAAIAIGCTEVCSGSVDVALLRDGTRVSEVVSYAFDKATWIPVTGLGLDAGASGFRTYSLEVAFEGLSVGTISAHVKQGTLVAVDLGRE